MARDLNISEASALEILREQGPLSEHAATVMGAGYLRDLKLLKRHGLALVDEQGSWTASDLGLELLADYRQRNPFGG